MPMKVIVDTYAMTIDPAARPHKRGGQAIAIRNRNTSGRHRGVIRGKREQITLTMPRELLVALDVLARRMGQARASLINRAIYELLEKNKP